MRVKQLHPNNTLDRATCRYQHHSVLANLGGAATAASKCSQLTPSSSSACNHTLCSNQHTGTAPPTGGATDHPLCCSRAKHRGEFGVGGLCWHLGLRGTRKHAPHSVALRQNTITGHVIAALVVLVVRTMLSCTTQCGGDFSELLENNSA
jgi:hypothetical protein